VTAYGQYPVAVDSRRCQWSTTAEESQAGLILGTVSDIANLTTGMSRKIWQTITLLSST
jgi:hypothetical protein